MTEVAGACATTTSCSTCLSQHRNQEVKSCPPKRKFKEWSFACMMTPASACHRNRKRHSTGIDHRSEGTKTAVNGESNKFVVSVKVTNILFITAGSSPAGSFQKSNQQVVSSALPRVYLHICLRFGTDLSQKLKLLKPSLKKPLESIRNLMIICVDFTLLS